MLFQPNPRQLKAKLLSLQRSPIPKTIKIPLLEGLLHEIKALTLLSLNEGSKSAATSQKNLEFSETTCTQLFPHKPGLILPQTTEDFELKIIQQQRTKVDLYQEIELHEDDLFQLEKVIKSKKQYDETLDRKIFQLQHLIDKNSQSELIQEKTQKKPISARIKQFFM